MIFLLHFLATAYMTGLIWFVQVVHYPLFARVPGPGFSPYHQAHMRRTSWVVAPAMVLELLTGALVLWRRPEDPALIAATALLIVVWISTAFIQVPLHRRLEENFDGGVQARLVASNWIRTWAWSLRSILLLLVLG